MIGRTRWACPGEEKTELEVELATWPLERGYTLPGIPGEDALVDG